MTQKNPQRKMTESESQTYAPFLYCLACSKTHNPNFKCYEAHRTGSKT